MKPSNKATIMDIVRWANEPPMMRNLLAAALLVVPLVAAAGCVGDPPAAQERRPTLPTSPTPPEPVAPAAHDPPRPNVTLANGSVAGAWVPGVAYFAASGKHSFDANVTNGTRALVIEVAWRTQDKLSLKADVPAKYCTDSDPLGFLVSCPSPEPNDAGTSPARIEITDPAMLARVGTWSISVWAQRSPNEAPFQIAISTFHDAPPPQGYSALPK